MMLQTIVTTKYFGPTNTRGSRIKVSTRSGSKMVSYDYAAPMGQGITEATLKATVEHLLVDTYAREHGDTFTVDLVTCVGGPDRASIYWIVDYTAVYG